MAPSEIMRRIKGRTASKLFEEFPARLEKILGSALLGTRIFCATAGQVTDEMIGSYLARHFEPNPDDKFKTED